MIDHQTTYVIGHRNPDMDSIASALGYAWLLNQVHGGGYTPARAGDVNAQTAWALERFPLAAPALVVDVQPRVADIVTPAPAPHGDPTVRQASAHFAATRRAVPLLDANGRPRGLISALRLFGHLVEPLIAGETASLNALLDQPAAAVVESETILLRDSDYLAEAVQRIRYVEPDDFLVVDATGRYRGLCRAGELLAAPRQRLVLVDHNELGQAVAGAAEAEIVEVLDHHRVDTVETVLPIRFQVEPVGSCATLVLEEAAARQLSFPPALAGLLLCGLLSDTLALQSPTTTARDRAAATTLARMAQLPGDTGEAIPALGRELLAAGAGLGARSAAEIVAADLKFYTPGEITLAIAQVEVTSFAATAARLAELQAALGALVAAKNLALALLLVTDILRANSQIVAAGDAMLIGRLPFAHLAEDLLDAPGIVSRKKQLVPAVLAAIRER